jgi:hypothetical protein
VLVTVKRDIFFHGAAPFLFEESFCYRQPTPTAGVAPSYFHSERRLELPSDASALRNSSSPEAPQDDPLYGFSAAY